uniref:Uncharacterized protein n=1 Tax=Saimiri boliviensis boliviensis TaxID=39432 RepID=A0A2K6SZE3_SAIBB
MTGMWKSLQELDQVRKVQSVLQTSRPCAVRVSHLSRQVKIKPGRLDANVQTKQSRKPPTLKREDKNHRIRDGFY